MSHDQFAVLSNQAVAACGVVYFLAVLANVGQWAASRHVPARRSTVPAESRAGVAAGEPAGDTLVAAGGNGPADVALEGAATDVAVERMDLLARIGMALTILAAAIHGVAVVSRGLAANPARVPWANMYEFTLTGTWFVVVGFLLLYRRYKLAWLAPVVTSFVLITLMADVVLLYTPVEPLRDALESPWLVIHVLGALTATGAFTIGGMCSALYLIKQRWLNKGGDESHGGYLSRLPSLEVLDRMAYRVHAFGFPVWTFAALIAGPIWAEHAWGRYWGWDPKETWAFITWVVYAAYLHSRATAGWRGRNAAIIALIGLGTLWFNFIGINFFFGSDSQHSYAAPVISHELVFAHPTPDVVVLGHG